MIKCVRCATFNSNAARFCDQCGAAMCRLNEPQIAQVEIWRSGESLFSGGATRQVADAPQNYKVAETTSARAHSRLIIERGKNAGKDFVLSETETSIGRWDAENGIFPHVDLDADDLEAKVSRCHARITQTNGRTSVWGGTA